MQVFGDSDWSERYRGSIQYSPDRDSLSTGMTDWHNKLIKLRILQVTEIVCANNADWKYVTGKMSIFGPTFYFCSASGASSAPGLLTILSIPIKTAVLYIYIIALFQYCDPYFLAINALWVMTVMTTHQLKKVGMQSAYLRKYIYHKHYWPIKQTKSMINVDVCFFHRLESMFLFLLTMGQAQPSQFSKTVCFLAFLLEYEDTNKHKPMTTKKPIFTVLTKYISLLGKVFRTY